MKLKPRVDALERRNGAGRPTRWLRIVQDNSQTQAEAINAFESSHGPTTGLGLIIREVVDPSQGGVLCA